LGSQMRRCTNTSFIMRLLKKCKTKGRCAKHVLAWALSFRLIICSLFLSREKPNSGQPAKAKGFRKSGIRPLNACECTCTQALGKHEQAVEMHRKSLEIATLLRDKSSARRAATNLAKALRWYSARDMMPVIRC